MTIDFNDLPDSVTVVDENGVPDHVLNFTEVADDAWNLALAIGAADGDHDHITGALREVMNKWGKRDSYVYVSAITQFTRDLLPAYAQLAKTTSGVDFAKHCRQMNNPDYVPEEVDQ